MTDERSGISVDESQPEPSAPSGKKHLPLWQETILLLAIAILLAVVIKAFFVQAFYIPSESMEPGLVKNDRILVEKTSYWLGGTPQRGDVVVFKDPGGWLSEEEDAGPSNPLGKLMAKVGLYPSGGHLVKRVIGVAGDTVHCCDKKGRILVNGHPLDEDTYIKRTLGMPCNGPMTTTCNWTAGPVPKGTVFVMGDNRDNSDDSTMHLCAGGTVKSTDCTADPYVPVSDVVGKVFVLLWPRNRFRFLHRPADFAGIPAPSSASSGSGSGGQ
ncbi:MAG TPA: signal peptidase I [Nocardioides sp.]|uniref:signal peptidase I n=1 Tax=Nocardioides sp. TaxID=35761 RepID=UPI002E3178BD|nr:signal peptidase I [Nocardioides sp.]HEX3929708.1 signal peptidase I [Nocardioides sp.]